MSILKKFANMTRRSNLNALENCKEKFDERFDKLDAGDYSCTCLNCSHCKYDGFVLSPNGPYSCYKHGFELTENEIKTYRCKDFDLKPWFQIEVN